MTWRARLMVATSLAAACGGAQLPTPSLATPDLARAGDAVSDGGDAVSDGGATIVDASTVDASMIKPACEWGGAPGQCLTATACSGLGKHTAEVGSCMTGLSCCIVTPNPANNPPTPAGYKLMMQSQVTPAMTSWAVAILHDPTTYPMFATAMMQFGALDVLARVEWHPPDFQNSIVHRGVTLYVPAP
jgi:hypothetical protein